MATRNSAHAPALSPETTKVRSAAAETAGTSRPVELTGDRLAAVETVTAQAPVLTPPGTAGSTAAVTGVTGTWTSGVMVDATWSINETRNAFFHVAGGGWKKIFNGTDGAFMALTTLVTQAKQTGHQIAIREEADGMVHEVYLW